MLIDFGWGKVFFFVGTRHAGTLLSINNSVQLFLPSRLCPRKRHSRSWWINLRRSFNCSDVERIGFVLSNAGDRIITVEQWQTGLKHWLMKKTRTSACTSISPYITYRSVQLNKSIVNWCYCLYVFAPNVLAAISTFIVASLFRVRILTSLVVQLAEKYHTDRFTFYPRFFAALSPATRIHFDFFLIESTIIAWFIFENTPTSTGAPENALLNLWPPANLLIFGMQHADRTRQSRPSLLLTSLYLYWIINLNTLI